MSNDRSVMSTSCAEGAPHYRVWCLSWEDDEENGSDIVAYNFQTHDYRQDRGVV